jgi:predicted DNA-binding WGR domain protein
MGPRNTGAWPKTRFSTWCSTDVIPPCNMDRYYVLSIETSLFGDATLIREWGRIGRPGQRRVELYENQACAAEALETWLHRKRRRGYLLRGG